MKFNDFFVNFNDFLKIKFNDLTNSNIPMVKYTRYNKNVKFNSAKNLNICNNCGSSLSTERNVIFFFKNVWQENLNGFML